MDKGLKTAIIVEIVVLVVALAFSIAFFRLGLYRTSQIPTIALIALWVLVAAVLLFAFWSRSLQREEMIRRFYLNKDWIYNHEIGYAPVARVAPDADEFGLVTFAADSLAQMSYGFEIADPPDDFVPDYLVTSKAFRFHRPEAEDGGGLDADDQCVVIDRWEGTLLRLEDGGDPEQEQYTEVGTFANARELAQLLSQVGALS